MRQIVALLIVSWIMGIAVGAFSAPSFFIFAIVFCFVGVSLLRKLPIQLIVAGALLLVLGFLHGVPAEHTKSVVCSESQVSRATLTRTSALTPTQARYVFVREDGCELLVYAPRFPVLVRGTVADIRGKEETPLVAFASLPEYAHFLIDDNISLVVKNAEVAVVKNGREVLDTFRIRVVSRISTLFREPDASLVTAMIAGDQGMIPQDIKEIYRKSGITHILSISGLHVSIIAIVLSALISLLSISPGIRSLLISVLLWIYIVGVGSPSSAVRAGVFWTLYVLAYHMKALIGLVTVVLLTVALVLTVSPELARSIGFELSVMAVCGIGVALFFTKRMHLTSWRKGIVTLLAVSFGATLATAPLTLYYFGNLSIVGLITNMLVVPLLPVITYLVLIALFLQPFLYPVALVCSFVVHALLAWVVVVATVCASIPYGNFSDVSFPVWGIGVYYAVCTTSIMFLMRYLKISWREWWV